MKLKESRIEVLKMVNYMEKHQSIQKARIANIGSGDNGDKYGDKWKSERSMDKEISKWNNMLLFRRKSNPKGWNSERDGHRCWSALNRQ